MGGDRPERHLDALTGAYALDALDDLERAGVERHLATCESCAAEVRGFAETAARLAAGVAVPPPPSLRDRVLAEAARSRQIPPRVEEQARTGRAPSRAARWLSVAAAGLLVASVGLGAVAWNQYRASQRAQVAAATITDILADPGRTVVDAAFGEGNGTVVVSGNRVVVVGDDVAPLPEDQTYQLWFIDEAGARPSGFLEPVGDGRFWVDAAGIRPGDVVGVTVEPAGGSPQPTTEPVFTAEPALS